MFRFAFIGMLVLVAATGANGQDSLEFRTPVTLTAHHGFLIAHRPVIETLQKGHVSGLEATIALKTRGTHDWHHVYDFPETGLSLSWWEMGNKTQIGSVVAVIPYIDFPLAHNSRTMFGLKFGWGLCYVTKIFDPDDNYKNVAIGSHFNAAIILEPQVRVRIGSRGFATAGISFFHFSNGSLVTPNLGMNTASLTAGGGCNFGKPHPVPVRRLQPFHPGRRITVFVGAGIKQIYPAGGNSYMIASMSGDHNWHLTRKSAFGIGADVFYDSSIEKKMEEDNQEYKGPEDLITAGFHGGYELVISNLSLILQMGVFVYKNLENSDDVYHRIGIRYHFSEHFFAAMHLKTSWGKADFIESGIGYYAGKYKKP